MALATARAKSNPLIERTVDLYGDLIFDFCQAILWNQANAQLAFRAILKELRKKKPGGSFIEFERAWILSVASRKLQLFATRLGRKLSPSEQIMLDASLSADARLGHFDSYFNRLPVQQRILLLLKDKYGIPYPEIAAAMNLPEGSLKVIRQQALRTLEEWIWDRP